MLLVALNTTLILVVKSYSLTKITRLFHNKIFDHTNVFDFWRFQNIINNLVGGPVS